MSGQLQKRSVYGTLVLRCSVFFLLDYYSSLENPVYPVTKPTAEDGSDQVMPFPGTCVQIRTSLEFEPGSLILLLVLNVLKVKSDLQPIFFYFLFLTNNTT